MFQKDYWSMEEKELVALANQYNIPHIGRGGAQGEHWYFSRDYVIASLVNRDAALRTRWTTIVAIVSLLISIAAFCISIFRKS